MMLWGCFGLETFSILSQQRRLVDLTPFYLSFKDKKIIIILFYSLEATFEV